MTTHDEDKIIAQQARIEQLTNFIKYAQVSSGVCCCGDSMEGHPSPMTCGHSPVDVWDYYSGELLEAYPDDLSALRAHDEKLRATFQAGAAIRDAEIEELVAALEDNWNCNPCETTRQQKAFDVAQSVLAKVRKP